MESWRFSENADDVEKSQDGSIKCVKEINLKDLEEFEEKPQMLKIGGEKQGVQFKK